MMAESYDHFMIFSLEDTGERVKLDVSEMEFRDNNGINILDQSQVYVIVKEDLRRIFIWNGAYSPTRKKFIASRVASDLQNELLTSAHFHRCKIISVDQGDEPYEFLSAFGFKSLEVSDTENIPQSSLDDDKLIHQWKGPPPKLKEIEPSSPSLTQIAEESYSEKQSEPLDLQKNIINTIISNVVPENFKRQNLILGDFDVFGAVIKKVKIFGKETEEIKWEPIHSSSKGVVQIDNHSLRLYFNNNSGILEGIEILEPLVIDKEITKQEEIDYSKWTVKELKAFCKTHEIKVPSSYRKAQIVKLVEEFSKKNSAS
ncbi:MAG: hypothetical protein ACFE9R_04415 [Candidatus Hermodarchaeota archaeon]